MTGILVRKAQWEREAVEAERKRIAGWLRDMAKNLTKVQADCLIANAQIIERNGYVVERGDHVGGGQ